MNQCLLVCWVFMVATATAFGGEGGFSHAISPDDFKEAGLSRLSPAELKHLDELIAAYKNPEVAAARRAAEEAIKAKKVAEAEAQAAKKEAQVAKTETQAAKAEVAESKQTNKGFFDKAKVLLVPGTKIEYAVIKTTIEGEFEGWDGPTVFKLANGQRWRVANPGEHYFTPPMKNVEVQITPAALGGYWMDFPDIKTRVRVRLLSNN